MRFAWWENFILLSVLTLVLAGPIWADGMPDTGPVVITDYGHFLGELQAGGALQFYDNTEEILRLAQFERALMRYRFLKGQIQRSGDYRGLLSMVDLRLRFLKKQLHLQERDIAACPARKARIPQPKPPQAKPPEKSAAGKPTPPGATANDKNKVKAGPTIPGRIPGMIAIPGPPQKAGAPPVTAAPTVTAPTPVTAGPPEAAAQKPEVVTTTPKTKEEKAEEEKDKEEAKPPPPPSSFWEKMKIRLHLQKKAAESGS